MKTLFVFCLTAVSLLAAQIHWQKDLKTAIEQAKQVHRPIFFVVSRHSCRWCVHLERTTFRDPGVIKTLNRDFVNVIAFTDDGDFIPRDLYSPATPTLWFLDENGEPMFRPVEGAVGASDMLRAAEIVRKSYAKRRKRAVYGSRPAP